MTVARRIARAGHPAGLAIRSAGTADLDQVRRIHTASWQTAYVGMLPDAYLARVPERHAVQWAQLPPLGVVTVATLDDEVVGFACVLPGDGEHGDHLLDNLHVDPARRGEGIGAALLHDVLDTAACETPGGRSYLWVFEQNTGGRRFYARAGGTEGGTRVEVLAPGVEVLERQVGWQL